MHLFKAWDNYKLLYDELDIRFIKWECDDWIQWNHKKAESKYKVMVFRWDEIYEWCWNTRTEDEIIEKEPEVISPEDEQQIQYLENLVSWDINNNETTQIQENYVITSRKCNEADVIHSFDAGMIPLECNILTGKQGSIFHLIPREAFIPKNQVPLIPAVLIRKSIVWKQYLPLYFNRLIDAIKRHSK